MDRLVANENKNRSDARDEWKRFYLLGREEYSQGYDVNDYHKGMTGIPLREWISGWWSKHDEES